MPCSLEKYRNLDQPPDRPEVEIEFFIGQAELRFQLGHLRLKLHQRQAQFCDLFRRQSAALHPSDRLFFEQPADQFDQSQDEFGKALFDGQRINIDALRQTVRHAPEFFDKLGGVRGLNLRLGRQRRVGGIRQQLTPNPACGSRIFLTKTVRRPWPARQEVQLIAAGARAPHTRAILREPPTRPNGPPQSAVRPPAAHSTVPPAPRLQLDSSTNAPPLPPAPAPSRRPQAPAASLRETPCPCPSRFAPTLAHQVQLAPLHSRPLRAAPTPSRSSRRSRARAPVVRAKQPHSSQCNRAAAPRSSLCRSEKGAASLA